tara:strand:+ start:1793 stop:1987 length:195 start_codon:yes stop_codon:yes gene_type:complete
MEKIIYRVKDKKGKYQQSYSSNLKDAYCWAVACADITKGEVFKDTLNSLGVTEASVKVYPKKLK